MMKTIFKYTAAAVTLLLLVFASCAPELEARFEETWKEDLIALQDVSQNMNAPNDGYFPVVEALYVNDRGYSDDYYYWDTYKSKWVGYFGAAIPANDSNFPGGPFSGNNKIYVNFDSRADVLKGTTSGDDLVRKMSEFLKFYTYTKTTTEIPFAQDALQAGWTLSADKELKYKFVKKLSDTEFELEFERKLTKEDSHVVYKITGDKYTYNNGIKVDLDNNGIAGEEGYDDEYGLIYVVDIIEYTGTPPNETYYERFIPPMILNFELQLQGLGTTGSGTTDTSTARNIILASDVINGSSLQVLGDWNYDIPPLTGNDAKRQELYENFIKAFKDCFSIEKYNPTTNTWELHVKAEFNDSKPTESGTFGYKQIVAKNVQFTHGVAYRAKFDLGSVPLVTADKIMGLNQRIKITGNGQTITERNKQTIITTTPSVMWTNTDKTGHAPTFTSSILFHDFDNTNVKIKVKITNTKSTITDGGTTVQDTYNYYYLKDNKQLFMDNFKIYASTATTIANLANATDIREIKITDVKFLQEDLQNRNATATQRGINNQGYNVIEITLDPAYKLTTNGNFREYFFVGPGLMFANDSTRVQGTGNIWQREGWTLFGPYNQF